MLKIIFTSPTFSGEETFPKNKTGQERAETMLRNLLKHGQKNIKVSIVTI